MGVLFVVLTMAFVVACVVFIGAVAILTMHELLAYHISKHARLIIILTATLSPPIQAIQVELIIIRIIDVLLVKCLLQFLL